MRWDGIGCWRSGASSRELTSIKFVKKHLVPARAMICWDSSRNVRCSRLVSDSSGALVDSDLSGGGNVLGASSGCRSLLVGWSSWARLLGRRL